MTIYVDELFTMTPRTAQARSHGKQWCHMTTDSDDIEELHLMAQRLGLKRSYFQDSTVKRHKHYDLVPSKRALAIKSGARETTVAETLERERERERTRQGKKLNKD